MISIFFINFLNSFTKFYLDFLYHSNVLFNPSSKSILALKPNSLSALLVSNLLLGYPSGLLVSHLIFPLNLTNLEINSAKSLIDISKSVPRFTGSLLLYFSVASKIPSAASSTYKNPLVGLPVPQ